MPIFLISINSHWSRCSDRRELLTARAKRATEAPIDPLDAMLVFLQHSGIRDQLDGLLDEPARANLSARETLILLCELELARKHRRSEMALSVESSTHPSPMPSSSIPALAITDRTAST